MESWVFKKSLFELGVVAHAHISSIQETETGGHQVLNQPGIKTDYASKQLRRLHLLQLCA